MKLLLFDIDGTIIRTGRNKVHYEAFEHAMLNVLGKSENIDKIHPQGKIDSQILIETLELLGISKEDAINKLPELFIEMTQYYKSNIGSLTDAVLPGVTVLLEKMAGKDGIIIGLLTGNLEAIAWAKMEAAGIREYFVTGAFGNEALKRAELVPIALEKTKDFGTTLDETYLIGDTPLDIACAKEAGCKVIAVATGEFSLEDLRKNDPDFLTNNIIDVLKFI